MAMKTDCAQFKAETATLLQYTQKKNMSNYPICNDFNKTYYCEIETCF